MYWVQEHSEKVVLHVPHLSYPAQRTLPKCQNGPRRALLPVTEGLWENVKENCKRWQEQMNVKHREKGRDEEQNLRGKCRWMGLRNAGLNDRNEIIKFTFLEAYTHKHRKTQTHKHIGTLTQVTHSLAPGKMTRWSSSVSVLCLILYVWVCGLFLFVGICVCVCMSACVRTVYAAFCDWQCRHVLSRPYGWVKSINKQHDRKQQEADTDSKHKHVNVWERQN